MTQTASSDSLQPGTPRQPVVRAREAGRTYPLPSGPQTALISVDDSEGAYELIEIEAFAGMGPPLHIHRDFDEAFYVLEGELKLRVNGEDRIVPKGGAAVVPAGAVHTWKNATDATIRFLQFTAPGGMEGLTAELSTSPTKLPLEEVSAVAHRHGTTIVGPPI